MNKITNDTSDGSEELDAVKTKVAPPAPAAGSAVDDISDAIGLLKGRHIQERAHRMGPYAAQDLQLAIVAMEVALLKLRNPNRIGGGQ